MNKRGGKAGFLRLFQAARAVVLPVALFAIGGGGPARADLTHRYTFNDGTALDSVGNADGNLLGNTFIDVDGLLQLPGGSADYVTLNAPAINIASYTDATFEAWFTVDQLLTWERVFDFGDRTVAAAQQGYVYYTPQGSNGGGFAVYATGGSRTEAPHGTLQTGHLYHLAMVIDDDANGGSDSLSVYLDGALQTSVGHTRSLSNVLTTFAYLGESLISGDPNFNGTIDEFSIYNHALSQAEVTSKFNTGPAPASGLRLEVNTVTGSVAIIGAESQSLTFDYYTITSASGVLDPAGWSSLDDQGTDTIGPDPGQSWDEAPPAATDLTEFYLLGASMASANERMELGHAYNPFVLGQGVDGDLSFRFSTQLSSQRRFGEIIYVTPDPLDGDYNGDLTVNAADYTIWRNAVGGTYNAAADGDGDGMNDRDDYVIWKWTYGNSAGTGAISDGTGVPEPAAFVVALVAVIQLAFVRARRRAING